MIIRSPIKRDLHYDYNKIDRKVFEIAGLTDGAKVLYGYLAGLYDGQNYNDKYILGVLNISQAVLTRRKKELKDKGLILIERIDMRTYALYIGWTKRSASKVKEDWNNRSDV